MGFVVSIPYFLRSNTLESPGKHTLFTTINFILFQLLANLRGLRD